MTSQLISRYVVGFLFDPDENKVLLVCKNRPAWQAGKLNGIGGHAHIGEEYDDAMVREFREETGVDMATPWEKFAILNGLDWQMFVYRATADITGISPENDVGESQRFWIVDTVRHLPTIPNLQWLIPMALMRDRRNWPYSVMEIPGK